MNMSIPIKRKFAVREISKLLPQKSIQTEAFDKPSRESNVLVTNKIFAFENQLKDKASKEKKEARCCRNSYYTIGYYVNKVMESLIFHVLVLLLSVFSLFNNDIMTIALPIGVDKAFHKINEFIFIFFLTELILFSLFKHNFLGSFYFYLDIIALISLLPEVSFIWIPLSYVLTGKEIDKNDPTMTTVISNLHLVKASRTSQLGSKASKYIKLLRLLNFLKIARLSKVIEESQKLKRENLSFLTNIFGKATTESNIRLKKLNGAGQSNLKTNSALEKPKDKLFRFHSKFWNKKKKPKLSKRGIGESPKIIGQNNLNNDSPIKRRFNKNPSLDKTKNANNLSKKDGNMNDINNETYKYDRIFNSQNLEGKSIKFNEVSEISTVNHDKAKVNELNPDKNRKYNIPSKFSSGFRFLNQSNKAEVKEPLVNELDNNKKNLFRIKSLTNNSQKIINLNTIQKPDSSMNTIHKIDEDSKTNFLKTKDNLSFLNNRNSFKSQSYVLPEPNIESDSDSNIKKSILKKGMSEVSQKGLKIKMNKPSMKTIKNVIIPPLQKERDNRKEKNNFHKSLFPVSKLSSSIFFLGTRINESNKLLSNIANKNINNNKIRRSLAKKMSGKSSFPFLASLNKNSQERILKKNVSSNDLYPNKINKNANSLGNQGEKFSFGYRGNLKMNNSKISISNKFSSGDQNNKNEKISSIRFLLKNNFNQFKEEEIKSLLNRANSDDENSNGYENPLQKELEIFLKELNISINDLFEHKMEGLSDLENYEIEDNEEYKMAQMAEEYNQNIGRFNIDEILNGKSEIIEKEEEQSEINSSGGYSWNFSSMDSSKVSSVNEQEVKAEEKNLQNKQEKNNLYRSFKSEKIPEVVCLNKEDNKISDFYGDLKIQEKKNLNKQKANKKPSVHKKISSLNSSKGENTPIENKQSTLKYRTSDSDVNNILKNEVDEINIIKKNFNKIKKLNIQVEEINKTPVNPMLNPIINSSIKTKKITKTEYIKEEKIYEIKNKSREDLRKSSASPINKKYGKVNSNEKNKINKNTPEFKSESKIEDNLEELKKIKVFNTDKYLHSRKLAEKDKKKESSGGLICKNQNTKAFDSEKLALNIEEEKNTKQLKIDTSYDTNRSQKDKQRGSTLDDKHHDKRQTLEEIIMESLTQKVVILILLLLIMLPVLGGEYIKTFLLNDEELEIKNYCMIAIEKLFNESIKNDSFLPNLKRHIESCETISVDVSDSLDFNSTEPYFLYVNFSDYLPYKKIFQKYNNTNYYKFIPEIAYDNLTKRPDVNYLREGYDFLSDNYFDDSNPEVDDSKITFITNNHIFLIIDNTLGILKSVFVGVVLVWGAFLVSNDVNVLLIFPLERIKTKMNYLISNSDELFIKNEKIAEQEKNVSLFLKNKTEDKSLQAKSVGQTELKILDNSIESVINLVNMSLGQNVLKIISSAKDDQNLKINLNQEGIKFNACYMFFKMVNLDNFVKTHKEKALVIINKINYVIQSIATIHLGEINNQRNLVLWKEDLHEVYYDKIRYLLKIIEKPINNIDLEIDMIRADYDLPTFFKKDLIIQLAFLTANKIIASLFNNLFETFKLFLLSGATLNFTIDYGEISNGLAGSEYKLDEILIGKNLTFFDHISNKINYKLPSIVISHEIYESISDRLRENFFICDIILKKIKSNGSFVREIIYRQYVDFSCKKYLEENTSESLNKKDNVIFIKKQKINEEASAFLKTLTENSDDFENFLIKDTEYKLNTNLVNNNMINAINGVFFDILNKQIKSGKKKIKSILKNLKEYNEIFEYNISFTLKNLDQKLKEYLNLKKDVFYTIDLTEKLN